MTITSPLDVSVVRRDFPLLSRESHGRRISYLDTAASSLPPHAVVAAMDRYYETTHANVHRGVYETAEEATRLFESARTTIGRFLGAPDPAREIIFTRNTTESINLLARTWGEQHLGEGDAVVLTLMEHHANIVPWQMLAERTGVELRFLGLDDQLRLDLSNLDELLDGAKLLSVTAMSNVLGTVNPINELAAAAHAAGALIHVDGAQAALHLPHDVADLDIDFLSLSGHKMLGPTGIGVLWGRAELLADLSVAAPTSVVETIGLAEAVRYITALGVESIHAHESMLTTYALDRLSATFGDGITIYGPPSGPDRGGVISFELGDVHAHDVAQILDSVGVCVRPGHHCAKPLMRHLGVQAAARASFGPYSGHDDVDALVAGLEQATTLFL